MTKQRIGDLLTLTPPQEGVEAVGWLRTARRGKGVLFFEISDGSSMNNLQIVIGDEVKNFGELSALGVGAAVSVSGRIVESPAKGQEVELLAEFVTIVGPSDKDYPLQKKRHSFEFLRTIAHLRPRARTFTAVFRVRHALQMAVHRFFDDRGFLQVHTPIITASDCEGAGRMFRVSSLDPSRTPGEGGNLDYEGDFFGRETSLTVSGQLEAEIFAHAFRDVYSFGPTFRAEDSNTSRHAAEFWMIEPEMAFCDLEGCARLAEDFLRTVVADLLTRCPEEMEFFDRWIENDLSRRLEALVGSSFEMMTYTEAVDRLVNSGENFEFPVRWGVDLQSEHERYLTEKLVGRPLFVVDYPRDIKAFYMRLNDDTRTVAAMDLLVPQVGEILGGAQREDRLPLLRKQMQHFGLRVEDYWWYLDLRRYGGVPHSGFGLGFERALMYVTGMKNIRDVIPFPRTPGSAEF